MRTYSTELEVIANDLLSQSGYKPSYSKKDFMNATIIFSTALMDKMYDMQEGERMNIDEREKMATSCGLALKNLIHTYTGLDTHKVEEFI